MMGRAVLAALAITIAGAQAQDAERKIDPTFLHRALPAAREVASDISTPSCHYKPLFGAGDPAGLPGSGIARFGTVTIDPKGSCKPATYAGEDQIFVVLSGSGTTSYGSEQVVLAKEDFLYIPATVPHALRNDGTAPVTVAVMGYLTKGFAPTPLPAPSTRASTAAMLTVLMNTCSSSARRTC